MREETQGDALEARETGSDGPKHRIDVAVRWWDGYLERFEVDEVRAGSDLLWMRLANGRNRHIPTRHVRWWSLSEESHEESAAG